MHTPGPWKVAKYQVGTVVTNYEPKEGRTVGYSCGNDFVADLDDGKYHKYLDEKEREANARLIAAAPDLLEALEVARERVFWDMKAEGRKALRTIDAALKKARGDEE